MSKTNRAKLLIDFFRSSQFQRKYFQAAFFFLITLLLTIPYTLNIWWKFFPSLIFIVLLMRWKSKSYIDDLGVRISIFEFAIAVVVFIVAIVTAQHIIPELLEGSGIILLQGDFWHIGWRLMPITQSLAEELVLRALLLNGLLLLFQERKFVSLLAAIIFASWHFAFFPYAQGVWLSASTILTLFLFGYASNNLFLTFRNIALPFALHAGWNTIKFGGEYFDRSTLKSVTEALAFNAVEGSHTVLALALGLVIISEIVARCWKSDRNTNVQTFCSTIDRNGIRDSV